MSRLTKLNVGLTQISLTESQSNACVQFSNNVKQRYVLRNVPPAQMYVMSDAAVFVPGYLS